MVDEGGLEGESVRWIMMVGGLGMSMGKVVGGGCGDL